MMRQWRKMHPHHWRDKRRDKQKALLDKYFPQSGRGLND